MTKNRRLLWAAAGAALLYFATRGRAATGAAGSGASGVGGIGALAPINSAFPLAPDGSTVVTPTGVVIPPPPLSRRDQKRIERREREGTGSPIGAPSLGGPGGLIGSGKGPITVGPSTPSGPWKRPRRRDPGGPA